MPHVLYEHLENAGYLKGTEVNTALISSVKPSALIDCSQQSREITSAEQIGRETSVFAMTASLALGGGTGECCEVGCRMERVSRLAQFAALYSDRVYIQNFLANHSIHCEERTRAELELMREFFRDDLLLLAQLRPLVEAGYIVPVTVPENICVDCLTKSRGGKLAAKLLKSQRLALVQRLADETRVEVRGDGSLIWCRISGLSSFHEHDARSFGYRDPPPALKAMDRVMTKLRNGQTAKLSRSASNKLGLHRQVADEEFRNIAFELASAQSLNTTYLTESKFQVGVLNSLSGGTDIEERNRIIEQHMTSLVPFAGDLDAGQLLRLRLREDEAFTLYRQSLNSAVDEIRKQKSGFTERDARAIHGDIISPKLAQLDSRVKIARKKLVKGTVVRTVAWTGAISFGIYAGLVPAELVEAAKAFGLTKIAADLASKFMGADGVNEDLRSEDMYFLWRVREKTKKR